MIVNISGKEVKLPDFIIIGAARGGTTSLYHYLTQYSQIFMSKRKEPQFFSNMDAVSPGKKAIRRIEDYVKLFEDANDNQLIGEASTTYLYLYENTIRCIKSVYGEKYKSLKIVAILRNPIDRAFSHYLQLTKKGEETLSFKDAINSQVTKDRAIKRWVYDYIEYGKYSKRVKAFMKEFPFVKIYLHEDLKDSKNLVRDLIEFLGIDSSDKIDTNVTVNPSGIPKNKFLINLLVKKSKIIKCIIPRKYIFNLVSIRDKLLLKLLDKAEMDYETKRKLIDVYKEDILELKKLIKRDLNYWLEVKK